MNFTRNRGAIVAVVVALFLFPPAVVPLSASPWEPAPLARAEEGLIAQLWQWLGSLFAFDEAESADPTETTESGTCTGTGGNTRGCAIDPNGGTGGY